MAPRLPRRPRAEDDPEDPDEPVRLDDEAHAWWAQRPAEELLKQRRPPPPPPAPAQDILAEHFGPDWRTSWVFDPVTAPEAIPADLAAERSTTSVDETPARGGRAAVLGPVSEHPRSVERPEPASPPLAPAPPRAPTEPDAGEVPSDRAAVDGWAGPVDAYSVLGVLPTVTWEDIVAAHRALAWLHHPDRVASEGPEAIAAAEEQIRQVNAAYAELRIRRGR